MNTGRLIIIGGPTAIGKTRLAVALAASIHGEIISADSRQIYRGMDIGTGKDIADYSVAGQKIPYHLIDIKDAGYKYNIKEYYADFVKTYKQITERGRQAILCGGSGLYIETALRGNAYAAIPENPKLRSQVDQLNSEELEQRLSEIDDKIGDFADFSTRKKQIRAIEMDEFLKSHPLPKRESLDLEPIIFILEMGREKVKKNIRTRLESRLESGMVEEVQSLIDSGVSVEDLKYYGLEYKWITDYLEHTITYDEMVEGLNIAIRQFAKRQMTWFRRMEKQGYTLHWIRADQSLDRQLHQVQEMLQNQ